MRSILKVEKLAVAVVQPELYSKAYLSSRMLVMAWWLLPFGKDYVEPFLDLFVKQRQPDWSLITVY